MKVLILDNYDSFTYNLAHLVEQFTNDHVVIRNDEITLKEVDQFDRILLSPGPGLSKDAGLMPKIIAKFHDQKPILGVCLGMQGIASFYGAELYNLNEVSHGVESICIQTESSDEIYENIEKEFKTGRYHSWAVKNLPKELEATSIADGIIMSVKHKYDNVRGIQFHPESIMTPSGKKMIENWIYRC